MHPIDRLIRRVQTEPGSRNLDLQIARALYGRDVLYDSRDGRYLVIRNTRASLHKFEVPRYTATRQQVERACSLLRRRRAVLTAEPLRMAA
jgi:hypothetical protein